MDDDAAMEEVMLSGGTMGITLLSTCLSFIT